MDDQIGQSGFKLTVLGQLLPFASSRQLHRFFQIPMCASTRQGHTGPRFNASFQLVRYPTKVGNFSASTSCSSLSPNNCATLAPLNAARIPCLCVVIRGLPAIAAAMGEATLTCCP
jgi:hypothetical protein